jgi:hypothetical protein
LRDILIDEYLKRARYIEELLILPHLLLLQWGKGKCVNVDRRFASWMQVHQMLSAAYDLADSEVGNIEHREKALAEQERVAVPVNNLKPLHKLS